MEFPSTTIDAIRAARERIRDCAIRTPLVRIDLEGRQSSGAGELWVKLENLQPIGSFKLRGAGNAMALISEGDLAEGVITASAGNMAQGVAWNARRLGIPCRVIVPDHAPKAKLDAIKRLGGEVVKVPFAEWWHILVSDDNPPKPGRFIHPVCDPNVLAGNGTIGLEILEDLPDVDRVIVPYGGGGLVTGIATALAAERPEAGVYAAEVETAAPLAAALANGAPIGIDYQPSFVDGIGGSGILPAMWPAVSELVRESLVVSLDAVAGAIRILAERCHVIAEGAGAASLAAALDADPYPGKTVCIISGGNLNHDTLSLILRGETPTNEARSQP